MLHDCAHIVAAVCINIIPNTAAVEIPAFVPLPTVLAAEHITRAEALALNRGLTSFSEQDRWINILATYGPYGEVGAIRVNLADRRLYVVRNGTQHSYPISIGEPEYATPVGDFRVVGKRLKPTWYPPPTARKLNPTLPKSLAPGPSNPLGDGALYLDKPSYLIHGTEDEWSVGDANTLGCLRLYNHDILEVLGDVPVGSRVAITNSGLVVWAEGGRTLARFALFQDISDGLVVRYGRAEITGAVLANLASTRGVDVHAVIFVLTPTQQMLSQ